MVAVLEKTLKNHNFICMTNDFELAFLLGHVQTSCRQTAINYSINHGIKSFIKRLA